MKPAKNKKYLEWIRSQECIVTENPTQVVAHHITIGALRGYSQKPTDYWAIPLDTFEHQRLHHRGEIAYWRGRSQDPHLLIITFLARWMQKLDIINDVQQHVNTSEVAANLNFFDYLRWARFYDEFLTEKFHS